MNDQVSIAKRRIEAMVDLIALVSVQEPDPQKHVLPAEEDDDFGMLEATINAFIRELAENMATRNNYLAQVQAAQKDLEEKLATIERQREAIRELSTPVIELWDDVLTLPIVGLVDTRRAAEMTEQLLNRIAERQTRCVIIDITGVEVVDTATAAHLIKMTNAARLLGAHCVMTGISPVVAQTLVQIGVELGQLRTLRSLKDGLKDCFAFLNSRKHTVSHNDGPSQERHER